MEQYPCVLEIHFVVSQRINESQTIYRKMDLPFNPFYVRGGQIILEYNSQGASYNGYGFEIKEASWRESKPEIFYVVLHRILASMDVCIETKKKFLADEKGRYTHRSPSPAS